ncbi:MAG: SDR family oxidoreductase [Caulobacterales bacterium]|nr:SDR family oxidoreductase [Caulobacterales bacterium]
MTGRGVALVTGGVRRIGRALAEACAEAGYDVAVHHRGGHEGDHAVEALKARGVRAAAFAADLAQLDADALIAAIAAELGPVTLLVNSASVFDDDRIGDLTDEGWDAHLDVNLRAPVMLAQAMAAQLPADREGLVVNIVDQRVLRPNPQFFTYSLSKAGLWWATRTLAQGLAPRVRVNAIGPGPTLPSIHQADGEFDAEAAATPLGRSVEAEEIAHALRYLIDARSVTGQMIAVDAGQHLAWRTPDIQGD